MIASQLTELSVTICLKQTFHKKGGCYETSCIFMYIAIILSGLYR